MLHGETLFVILQRDNRFRLTCNMVGFVKLFIEVSRNSFTKSRTASYTRATALRVSCNSAMQVFRCNRIVKFPPTSFTKKFVLSTWKICFVCAHLWKTYSKSSDALVSSFLHLVFLIGYCTSVDPAFESKVTTLGASLTCLFPTCALCVQFVRRAKAPCLVWWDPSQPWWIRFPCQTC